MADDWAPATLIRASLADQVCRELREAIVGGQLAPGARLREAALAQTFGTGRGVVREALRQLVQEGLIEHVKDRGAMVRLMSLEDRLDVYAAREALESGAALKVIEAGQPDCSGLEQALDRIRLAVPADGQVTEALIDADLDFHRALVALARSSRLTRAHETLLAETRILLRHHPAYTPAHYVAEHQQTLKALRARDPSAPRLVAEHARLSARLIADELTRQSAHRDGHTDPTKQNRTAPDSRT
jgi:DNA-binding GntR family transcriptional regulator